MKSNTGIILGGPNYFKNELFEQKRNEVQGIPELIRRIDMFIDLDAPSNNEKRELFKQNGFKNQNVITNVIKDCEHLGDVYRIVKNFSILAERTQLNVK